MRGLLLSAVQPDEHETASSQPPMRTAGAWRLCRDDCVGIAADGVGGEMKWCLTRSGGGCNQLLPRSMFDGGRCQ
jgi:hypothetical protein